MQLLLAGHSPRPTSSIILRKTYCSRAPSVRAAAVWNALIQGFSLSGSPSNNTIQNRTATQQAQIPENLAKSHGGRFLLPHCICTGFLSTLWSIHTLWITCELRHRTIGNGLSMSSLCLLWPLKFKFRKHSVSPTVTVYLLLCTCLEAVSSLFL